MAQGALTSDALPVDVTRFGHSLYHAYVDYSKHGTKASQGQRTAWIPKMSCQQLTSMLSDLALMQPKGPLRPQMIQEIFNRCKPVGSSALTFGTFLQVAAAVASEADMLPDAVFGAIATLAVERPHAPPNRQSPSLSGPDDIQLSPTGRSRPAASHLHTPDTFSPTHSSHTGLRPWSAAADKPRFHQLTNGHHRSAPLDAASARHAVALAWADAAAEVTPGSQGLTSDSQQQQAPAWAQQLLGRLAALEHAVAHRAPGAPATPSGDDAVTGALNKSLTRSSKTRSSEAQVDDFRGSPDSHALQRQLSGQPLKPTRHSGGIVPPPGSAPWLSDLMHQILELKGLGEQALQLSQESKVELDSIKQSLPDHMIKGAPGGGRDSAQSDQAVKTAAEIDSIKERLDKLTQEQQSYSSKLTALKDEMQEAISVQVQAVESTLQSRLTTVNTSCKTLSAQVAAIAEVVRQSTGSEAAQDAQNRAEEAKASARVAEAAASAAEVTARDAEIACAEATRNASQALEEVQKLAQKLTAIETRHRRSTHDNAAAGHATDSMKKQLDALAGKLAAFQPTELQARMQVFEDQLAALKLRQAEAEHVSASLVSNTVPAEQLKPLVTRLTEVEGVVMDLKAGKKAVDSTALQEAVAIQVTQNQLEAETALLWQQLQRRITEVEDTVKKSNNQSSDAQKVVQRLSEMDMAQQQLSSRQQSAQLQLQSLSDRLIDCMKQLAQSSGQPIADVKVAADAPGSSSQDQTAAVSQLQQEVAELKASIRSQRASEQGSRKLSKQASQADKATQQALTALSSRLDKLGDVPAILDKVKQAVSDCEHRVAEAQGSAKGASVTPEQLAASEASIRSQLTGLASVLQSMQARLGEVESRGSEQAELRTSRPSPSSTEHLAPLLNRVAEVEKALVATASRVNEAVGVADRMGGVETAVAGLRKSPAAAMPATLSWSDVEFAVQQAKSAKLQEPKHQEQLKALQQDVQRLQSEVRSQTHATGQAAGSVASEEVQKQFQELEQRVEHLTGSVAASVQQQVEQLQSDIRQLQQSAASTTSSASETASPPSDTVLAAMKEMAGRLVKLEQSTSAAAAAAAKPAVAGSDLTATITRRLTELEDVVRVLQNDGGAAAIASEVVTPAELMQMDHKVHAVQSKVEDLQSKVSQLQAAIAAAPPAAGQQDAHSATVAELQRQVQELTASTEEAAAAAKLQRDALAQLAVIVRSDTGSGIPVEGSSKSFVASAVERLSVRLDNLQTQLDHLAASGTAAAGLPPAAEQEWAVKTRELADKVAALEDALQAQAAAAPAPKLSKVSSTKSRSNAGDEEDRPSKTSTKKASAAAATAAATSAAEAATSRLVGELRESMGQTVDALAARVSTLEHASAGAATAAAAAAVVPEQPVAAAAAAAADADGPVSAQVDELRAAVFSKGAQGLVPREEMVRALGAIAQEVNSRFKELKEELAKQQQQGGHDNNDYDGRSSDNTLMRMVAQSGVELRNNMDSLRHQVDDLSARMAGANPGHDYAELKQAVDHIQNALRSGMFSSPGGVGRLDSADTAKLQSKVEEVASALVVVTERMNERVTAVETLVANLQHQAPAPYNRAMPPESPSLAYGMGAGGGGGGGGGGVGFGSIQHLQLPSERAMAQDFQMAADRPSPAAPAAAALWPGTRVAAVRDTDVRPKSARDKVHEQIAAEKAQARNLEAKLKNDEERVKAQRAAAANRKVQIAGPGEDEDEDVYGGFYSKPRSQTHAGMLQSPSEPGYSPAGAGGAGSFKNVGFNNMGSGYGGGMSDSGAAMSTPLSLDGSNRNRAVSLGGIMGGGMNSPMMGMSPAQLAAMQQNFQAKQQMAMRAAAQQNQMRKL